MKFIRAGNGELINVAHIHSFGIRKLWYDRDPVHGIAALTPEQAELDQTTDERHWTWLTITTDSNPLDIEGIMNDLLDWLVDDTDNTNPCFDFAQWEDR